MSGPWPLNFEQALVAVQAIALGALILRLALTSLRRRYPFFFCYLIALGGQSLLLSLVPRRTYAYGNTYMATEAVIVCFYALIILELYSIILRDLRGLATISRRYIRIALGLALALSLLLTEIESAPNLLLRFFVLERTIVFSLLCFLLLITGFLMYYPVRVSRNAIFYSIGYAIYFTSKSVTLLLRNTGHVWDVWLGTSMLAVSTICLIFWAFLLTEKGESVDVTLGGGGNLADNERVLEQLRAINAGLIRARKSL